MQSKLNAPNVIGFDQFVRLVDYLSLRAERDAWRDSAFARHAPPATLNAKVGGAVGAKVGAVLGAKVGAPRAGPAATTAAGACAFLSSSMRAVAHRVCRQWVRLPHSMRRGC